MRSMRRLALSVGLLLALVTCTRGHADEASRSSKAASADKPAVSSRGEEPKSDRAIAVVLTGTGSDGNIGVQAVKKMGGTVIAQDQATAEFFGMPEAAIKTGSVDFILPLAEIPRALVMLLKGGEA